MESVVHFGRLAVDVPAAASSQFMGSKRLTALFVTLMVSGCLVGIMVPAGLGWDFANFYDTGRRVASGQINDLYGGGGLIEGRQPQGSLAFFGTPISAVFYVPLSAFPAETALVWFKVQNVVAFFASFALLFSFYRRFRPAGDAAHWEFAATFTGLCLVFQPFWTVFRVGGQTTPTVLLLLTLAMICHVQARFWGSAICFVLATLIKPALAPALVFLACVSGFTFLWKTGATLLAAGLLSLGTMGLPVHAAFLDLIVKTGQLTYAWYYNSSLFILVDNLREWVGPAAAAGPYRALFVAATYGLQVGAVGLVVFLARKGHRERWHAAALRHFDFTMAVLLFLLWSRTLWEHYLSLLFLPLVYIVAARERFSRQALVLVAGIFVLCVFQNLIFTNWLRAQVSFESLPRLLGIAVFKSGPLLLTLAFLWRHTPELFRSYAANTWEEIAVATSDSPVLR